MPLFRLCADELWDGEMESFDAGGEEILLVKLDGEYCAYRGACPHQSTPLVEGEFAGGVITCRAHLWQFDARTGQGINPKTVCLRRYPLRMVGGDIYVEVDGFALGWGKAP